MEKNISRILISVIIPVFNTEKYVAQAVESIQNQSLKDIEIIIVDDCSTDGSLNVVSKLAKNDRRIKVLTMDKNSGQSVCRNKALEIAKGDYIYFFDSDDLLEADCLQKCCSKMESGNYDFLVFDGVSFFENGIKAGFNASYQRTKLLVKDEYKGSEMINYLIKEKSYSCSVCLCFIRKSFVEKNNLGFYPGVLYEDVLFTCQMFLSAASVTFVTGTFFHRRVRENSTMTSKVTEKNIQYRLVVGTQLLRNKVYFNDKLSLRVINHQTRNLFIFLVKTMLRSGQFNLLFKYGMQIFLMIFKSLRFW